MSDKAFRDYFIRKIGGYSILKMAKFDESTNKYESDLLCDYTQGFLDGSLRTFQDQQKKIDNIKTKSIEQALKLSGMSERNNKQAEIIKDQQKRIDAALQLIKSIKSENDLWGCEQVVVQIELLEQALKGGDE